MDRILHLLGILLHKCRNHHILGLALPHGYPVSRKAQKDVAECMRQMQELGGLAVLAHPPGVNVEPHLYADMPGLAAFELWATHQESTGGGDREAQWSAGLDDGVFLPAIAVDDAHAKSEVGVACTWLKMKSLSIKSMLTAIAAGACYGSTGPTVKEFIAAGDTVEIRCSACKTITLLGPGGVKSVAKAAAGKSITKHSMAKPDWPFVRAVLTDRRGGKAWINPIALD